MTIPVVSLLVLLVAAGRLHAHRSADHQAEAVRPSPEIERLKSLAAAKQAGAPEWIALGDALMQRARDRTAHDFTEAAAAYTRALACHPDHPDALAGMAWVKNSEHDFPAGKTWAERALARDPRQADAHALIGDGAVELGDYDLAFEHYQQALDSRADLSTLSRAGHLLWLTGDATRARSLMLRAIRAGGPHPENLAWCRAELALMDFHAGSLVSASQLADLAVEAAPDNPRVRAIAGRIAAAAGDLPRATAHYERSARVTPNHDALAALATLAKAGGDEKAAARSIERVLAFHGGTGRPHDHGPGNAPLARFLADHDLDPARALREARAAHARFPNIATTDTLAWCLLKAGKPKEARAMIRRAMKWGTPDAELDFHAAMIERALGEHPSARRHLARALGRNPAFHPLHARTAAGLLRP